MDIKINMKKVKKLLNSDILNTIIAKKTTLVIIAITVIIMVINFFKE